MSGGYEAFEPRPIARAYEVEGKGECLPSSASSEIVVECERPAAGLLKGNR